MRATLIAAALGAVALFGAPQQAQAQGWERYTASPLGISLLVPRGAKPTPRDWPQQWRGVQVDHKGVQVFAIARHGKKHTASYMEALGLRTSGVKAPIWTEFKTVEKKDGWVWYNRARVADDTRAAFTVYGVGGGASFVAVVVTTAADAKKRKADFERWLKGVQLKLPPKAPTKTAPKTPTR